MRRCQMDDGRFDDAPLDDELASPPSSGVASGDRSISEEAYLARRDLRRRHWEEGKDTAEPLDERQRQEEEEANQRRQWDREADALAWDLIKKTDTYGRLSGGGEGVGVPSSSLQVGDSGDDPAEAQRGRRRHADGEDVERRRRRERQRQQQESNLPPALHEVEIGNWEDDIDWDGAEHAADLATAGWGLDGGAKEKAPPPPKIVDPKSILRAERNISLDALDLTKTVDWDGGSSGAMMVDTPLILHEHVAGTSVARGAVPLRRPLAPPPDPRVAGGGGGSARAEDVYGRGAEEVDAEFEANQRRRAELEQEKVVKVTKALDAVGLGDGRAHTIKSQIMGRGGARRTGPDPDEEGPVTEEPEYVQQLDIVCNHAFVKSSLTDEDMEQFHRPILPTRVVRASTPWQFQTRLPPSSARRGKGSGANSGADWAEGMSQSPMVISTEADLSPARGDGSSLVVLEYCEERPPVQLSKGMTCRIVNYRRGDTASSGVGVPRSRGGMEERSSVRGELDEDGPTDGEMTGSVASTSSQHRTARRPPRLRGLDSMEGVSAVDLIGRDGTTGRLKPESNGTKKVDNDEEQQHKEEHRVDIRPEGVTKILTPKERGPFIGAVEDGTTQSGLISNLFTAPMFRHKTEPSDFLMVLGKNAAPTKNAAATSISLRRPAASARGSNRRQRRAGGEREGKAGSTMTTSAHIGVVLIPMSRCSLFCVGQTEPRMKVFALNGVNEDRKFSPEFTKFQIARALAKAEELEPGRGLTLGEIKKGICRNTPITDGILRTRIKDVANYGDKTWKLKEIGYEEFPGVKGLAQRILPEHVAAYETALAACHRMNRLGIRNLYHDLGNIPQVGGATVYLNGSARTAEERALKMRERLELAGKPRNEGESRQLQLFEKSLAALQKEWNTAAKLRDTARFIHEELQLAPWNLTSDFVDVHRNSQGRGMMQLTGLGDPSGRGEAFSFLREVAASNRNNAQNSTDAKIRGTDKDLSKLKMPQLDRLLRSYGMDDKVIKTLSRWGKVHVIRERASKVTGDEDGDLYARTEKRSVVDRKRAYNERRQEIWRRQCAALSADTGPPLDESSDSEFDDDSLVAEMEADVQDEPIEDERELAELVRREKERSAQGGLFSATERSVDRNVQRGVAQMDGRKAVRRRITTTYADGTQRTVFKFVVQPDAVERIIATNEKKQATLDSKKG